MSRMYQVLQSSTMLVLLVSCSQSHQRDLCDEGDPCSSEGELRCSADNASIETCTLNSSNCLIWSSTESCGDFGVCESSTGTPVCGCDDACDDLDESRCDGEVILQCSVDESGCLGWERFEDCEASNQRCDVVGDRARCTDSCEDECENRGDSRCVGHTVEGCDLTTLGCLEWIVEEECEDSFCDASSGEAQCVEECEDQCERIGALQCLGDILQLCDEDEEGCASWYDQEDCRELGLRCVLGSGIEAFCGCPNDCLEGELQCDGDVLEACFLDEMGCSSWQDRVDCAELGLICDDSLEPAGCLSGSGEGCDDVRFLYEPVTVISGDSFEEDFDNYMNFTEESCFAAPNAPDAVFAIQNSGDALFYMSERRGGGMGGVNVAFNIMASCDETAECVFAEDRGEGDGFYFEVPSDDVYYIVVEALDNNDGPYELIFGIITPEICDDGVDNDIDGDIDCDDDECFGEAPLCDVERNCRDRADNDDDGEVDCDDTDCSVTDWCSPYQGLWEIFEFGDFPDMESHSITFTPNDAVTDGYDWGIALGVTGFAVEPGSGDVSVTIDLEDDNYYEHALTELPGFEFYGDVYWSVFVGSNGFITFGEGREDWNEYFYNFFDLPNVSGLRSDLDPAADGVVTIDEFPDRLAVSFEGVPMFGEDPAPNDFQMVLHADGSIGLHYVLVSAIDVLIGISSGVGDGSYPDEVDFIPPIPEVCDDTADNDFDGYIDCEDSDCFGEAGCETETICDDWMDNDDDGLTDCEDPDCAGPECEPYRGYWERFDTDDEPDIEGHSLTFTPDDADENGYSWALSPVSSSGFPEAPGTGDVSTVLTLPHNEFEEYIFTEMDGGFPFYGTTYSSVFVSSNGYVTFGEGDGSNANEFWDHFELPSVAGYRRDIFETEGDTLWVDEFEDRVVVTYENAVGWAGPNSFQIVLHTSGEIDLHYITIPVTFRVTGLIGISSGVGSDIYPEETNFIP